MADDDDVRMGGDQGAILLIVLFVTTALALIIGVVLTNVDVNLHNSQVAQSLDDRTYAADGGVEYVIQRLRQDSNVCDDPSLGPWQQSGVHVDVSCQGLNGAAPFDAGWAAVTQTLNTQSGDPVIISGSAYVGDTVTLAAPLSVENGVLFQHEPPCPQPLPGFDPTCTTSPLGQAVPALPCTTACAPGQQFTFVDRLPDPRYVVDGCAIFLPGRYTAINLTNRNYFASGVYYFDDVGTIEFGGKDTFGGNRGAAEVAPGCSDQNAGVDDGSGVEWILGGTSAISVDSTATTTFELLERLPGASSAEGAPGLSIRTVPAGADGYDGSAAAGPIFSNNGGPGQTVAVHGLVYAPGSEVSVTTGAGGTAELAGGVVAASLTLHALPGTNRAIVSAASPTDTHQFVTITSIARGEDGAKDVTTTAVIDLTHDSQRSVVIDSWVTNAA